MNKARCNLDSGRKSNGSHAKPEQLAAKEQNHGANQRADDRDGEVHRWQRIFDSHGFGARSPIFIPKPLCSWPFIEFQSFKQAVALERIFSAARLRYQLWGCWPSLSCDGNSERYWP